ncbi:phosphatidylserine/phosphatidylglycerophosphate/cardiolipin synthase family protein [Halomonas sp. ISL-60]|uniref:hypothetical protein n=1 Tax=Halomonas sp. ISL-56 TaxID=2819149 RepID=UPI001BE7A2D7|nr:hypothetical protein [Halomonas sp. ISL-56]MBT2771972.1 phosphatidylserine/phosphatidylglycerophosphate/cardiolipin synthase family protein [Halomonas sp. ISL-60]MBT2802940.1 phosphatidylserine/phosphatidylglycerophosphate/cardiolipin synthase family protein [Halomonas sp. ISL-56]
MAVELMYGEEFWNYLEVEIPRAKKHVFLLSAYTSDRDVSQILNTMPAIPHLVLIRDDCHLNSRYQNLIFIDHKIYHAKVYIIDDTVIISSQNLNKVTRVSLKDKVGEISVKFNTNESSNIIYQALLLILRQEYEHCFMQEVCKIEEHHEISEQEAWKHVAGNLYLTEFKENNISSCPCCGHQINVNAYDIASCIEGEEDEEANYACLNCEFFIKVSNHAYCYDRPWERRESVTGFRCSQEFSLFLQLHFYLSIQIGRHQSLQVLRSLNMLGSIKYFDFNKRHYSGVNLWN